MDQDLNSTELNEQTLFDLAVQADPINTFIDQFPMGEYDPYDKVSFLEAKVHQLSACILELYNQFSKQTAIVEEIVQRDRQAQLAIPFANRYTPEQVELIHTLFNIYFVDAGGFVEKGSWEVKPTANRKYFDRDFYDLYRTYYVDYREYEQYDVDYFGYAKYLINENKQAPNHIFPALIHAINYTFQYGGSWCSQLDRPIVEVRDSTDTSNLVDLADSLFERWTSYIYSASIEWFLNPMYHYLNLADLIDSNDQGLFAYRSGACYDHWLGRHTFVKFVPADNYKRYILYTPKFTQLNLLILKTGVISGKTLSCIPQEILDYVDPTEEESHNILTLGTTIFKRVQGLAESTRIAIGDKFVLIAVSEYQSAASSFLYDCCRYFDGVTTIIDDREVIAIAVTAGEIDKSILRLYEEAGLYYYNRAPYADYSQSILDTLDLSSNGISITRDLVWDRDQIKFKSGEPLFSDRILKIFEVNKIFFKNLVFFISNPESTLIDLLYDMRTGLPSLTDIHCTMQGTSGKSTVITLSKDDKSTQVYLVGRSAYILDPAHCRIGYELMPGLHAWINDSMYCETFGKSPSKTSGYLHTHEILELWRYFEAYAKELTFDIPFSNGVLKVITKDAKTTYEFLETSFSQENPVKKSQTLDTDTTSLFSDSLSGDT